MLVVRVTAKSCRIPPIIAEPFACFPSVLRKCPPDERPKKRWTLKHRQSDVVGGGRARAGIHTIRQSGWPGCEVGSGGQRSFGGESPAKRKKAQARALRELTIRRECTCDSHFSGGFSRDTWVMLSVRRKLGPGAGTCFSAVSITARFDTVCHKRCQTAWRYGSGRERCLAGTAGRGPGASGCRSGWECGACNKTCVFGEACGLRKPRPSSGSLRYNSHCRYTF